MKEIRTAGKCMQKKLALKGIFLIFMLLIPSNLLSIYAFNLVKKDSNSEAIDFDEFGNLAYQVMITDTDSTLIPSTQDLDISTVEVDDNESAVFFRLTVAGSIVSSIFYQYEISLDYDHDGFEDHSVSMNWGNYYWDSSIAVTGSFSGASVEWVVPKTIEIDSNFTVAASTFNIFVEDEAPGDGGEWSSPYLWNFGEGLVEPFITGSCSDFGLDNAGDSHFEYLVVDVEVNITIAGNYNLSISGLMDPNFNLINVENETNAGYLTEGIYNISVFLPGTQIYFSQLNGPYSIMSADLEGDIHSSSRGWFYNTSAYNYTQFNIAPIFLTGSYSDYGVNMDADQAFEYLAVEIEVNVTAAENYTVSISMLTNQTDFIFTWNTTDAGYLSQGIHNVTVFLPGNDIFVSHIDGPYTLFYLQVQSVSFQGVKYDAYSTSAYEWGQFGVLSAYFLDMYYESVLDTDGNGRYNYLIFNVTVNITIAGDFTIAIVNLKDIASNMVYTGNSTDVTLGIGIHNVSIYIPGDEIFESRSYGPYTIHYLYVEDSSFVIMDWRYGPYTTNNAYSYDDFEYPPDFQPLYLDVSPDSTTLSFGGEETFTIELDNQQAYSDIANITIAGLPIAWYSVIESHSLNPYGYKTVPFLVSIPDVGATPGIYNVTVTALSDNFNTTINSTISLTVSANPVIWDLVPEDGIYLASNKTVVSWKTSSNCSTEVYIRKLAGIYTQYTGEYSYEHVVTIEGLDNDSEYEFYVSSLSTAGYRTNSSVRSIYTDDAVGFTLGIYEFTIDRDYYQQCSISVINRDNEPHEFLITLIEVPEDLAVNFIGAGSQDQHVLLYPGETSNAYLSIHAQDAQSMNYTLLVNLTNLGSVQITDFAEIRINVTFPTVNLTIEEIDIDPATLTKTIKITNIGDMVSDLSVSLSEELESFVILNPKIEQIRLGTFDSVTFDAIPRLWEGFRNASGSIIAKAATVEQIKDVNFTVPSGQYVFDVIYPNITVQFNKDFDQDNITNTNPLNNSFIDSYQFDNETMCGIYVAVDVQRGEAPIYDAEVILKVWNNESETELSGISDVHGHVIFSFHDSIDNYSYRVELPDYNRFTEIRQFRANSTPKFNGSVTGIQWVNVSDSDSYYNLTATIPGMMELDNSPFMFYANLNVSVDVNSSAILLLRPFIEGASEDTLRLIQGSHSVDIEGTLNGNLLSFSTEYVPSGIYNASILIIHPTEVNMTIFPQALSSSITLNVTDNYLDTQLSFQYQTPISVNSTHFDLMNLQQQSQIVDPRKAINLEKIESNTTHFTFTYYICANQSMSDDVIITVRYQNGTLFSNNTIPVNLQADIKEYLVVELPIYDGNGTRIEGYNITVKAVDIAITATLVILVIVGAGLSVGSNVAPPGWSHGIGVVKAGAGMYNPVIGISSAVTDLGFITYDFIKNGYSNKGAINGGMSGGSVAFGAMNPTGLGSTMLGGFGLGWAIADFLDWLSGSDSSKEGGAYSNEMSFGTCINVAPLSGDFDTDSGLQFQGPGGQNVESVEVTVEFPRDSPDWYEPFDTVIELNGQEIGNIPSAVPEGYYTFPANPGLLNFAKNGTVQNNLKLDVIGMNRGFYVPLKGFTIDIIFHALNKSIIAENRSEAYVIADTMNLLHPYRTDLGIHAMDLDFDQGTFKVGQNVSFNVTIHNIGSLDTYGVPIQVIVNNTVIKNATIVDLQAFSSEIISGTWTVIEGVHEFNISIDTEQKLQDSDYSNNDALLSVYFDDLVPPNISNPTPTNQSIIFSKRPYIIADLSDAASGINLWSKTMILNDSDITDDVWMSSRRIFYQPNLPLDSGTYTVYVYVEDKCGNNNSLTWSFRIAEDPVLNTILPNPDADGQIYLAWNNVTGATKYYIYRDTVPINDVSGLTPIATENDSDYTDFVSTNGIYHYAIVATNNEENSSISNCENVTVNISAPPDDGIPGFPWMFTLMGLIIGVVVMREIMRKQRKRW